MTFDSLLNIIDNKLSSGVIQSEGLQYICQLLFDHIIHYDWVGYYLHNQEKRARFECLLVSRQITQIFHLVVVVRLR